MGGSAEGEGEVPPDDGVLYGRLKNSEVLKALPNFLRDLDEDKQIKLIELKQFSRGVFRRSILYRFNSA